MSTISRNGVFLGFNEFFQALSGIKLIPIDFARSLTFLYATYSVYGKITSWYEFYVSGSYFFYLVLCT